MGYGYDTGIWDLSHIECYLHPHLKITSVAMVGGFPK